MTGLSEPSLPLSLELPDVGRAELTALPTKPGVFALEDADGRTLHLGVAANLRRHVRERLRRAEDARIKSSDGPIAAPRAVRATTAGSDFEADWIYLAAARHRLPHAMDLLLDRWRAWYVQVDPAATFPRLVRTAQPSGGGRILGPFRDKQAARRAIDILEDAFDLCRYHAILCEAPDGIACAYKEMGRCPAPCDGTVPMSTYRASMTAAVEFLAAPPKTTRAVIERDMQVAARALEFETAARLRRRLDVTAPLATDAHRYATDLDRMRLLAVAPSETSRARVFLVHGGFVAPILDAPPDTDDDVLRRLVAIAADTWGARVTRSRTYWETLGLVAWHLDRNDRTRLVWLRWPEEVTVDRLRRAMARVRASSDGGVGDRTMGVGTDVGADAGTDTDTHAGAARA